MNIIYEPKGRAKEYSQLAANLYNGCVHGCKYCYAPACLRQTRKKFHEKAFHRNRVLELLERDLLSLNSRDLFAQNTQERVLLCFTSDPYQGDSQFNSLTRQALGLFQKHNVDFQVLTKGGIKAARDFDLYSPHSAFACTLTFLDENRSKECEPEATPPKSRIQALQEAKKRGIETWVSFEPVLDEQSVYDLLDATWEFVDLYKVGKCSGDFSQVRDWSRFGRGIIEKLQQLQKKYYIKEDLARCLV